MSIGRDDTGSVISVNGNGNGRLTDEVASLLYPLVNLRELRAGRQPGFTSKGLQSLADKPKLAVVDLTLTGVSPEAMSILAKCPVRALYLSNPESTLTDDGLIALPAWDTLEEFWTQGPYSNSQAEFTRRGAASLARYPRLHTLAMNWCGLDDEFVLNLPPLPELRFFQAWHSDLSSLGISSLKRFRKLRSLHYISSQSSEVGLEALVDCDLRTLDIGNLPNGDQAVPALIRLDKLEFLRLMDCHLTVSGARQLCEGLGAGVKIELAGQSELQKVVDEHEARRAGNDTSVKLTPDPGPAAKTARWTAAWTNIPARNLLRVGGLQKYELWYDVQALADAGVVVDQSISIDVKNGTDADHLRAICDQLELQFRVDGTKVTLFPQQGSAGRPTLQRDDPQASGRREPPDKNVSGGGFGGGGGAKP